MLTENCGPEKQVTLSTGIHFFFVWKITQDMKISNFKKHVFSQCCVFQQVQSSDVFIHLLRLYLSLDHWNYFDQKSFLLPSLSHIVLNGYQNWAIQVTDHFISYWAMDNNMRYITLALSHSLFLTSILLKLRIMEVVVTTGAVSRAKLQSNCHHHGPTFYRVDALPVALLTGALYVCWLQLWAQ